MTPLFTVRLARDRYGPTLSIATTVEGGWSQLYRLCGGYPLARLSDTIDFLLKILFLCVLIDTAIAVAAIPQPIIQ